MDINLYYNSIIEAHNLMLKNKIQKRNKLFKEILKMEIEFSKMHPEKTSLLIKEILSFDKNIFTKDVQQSFLEEKFLLIFKSKVLGWAVNTNICINLVIAALNKILEIKDKDLIFEKMSASTTLELLAGKYGGWHRDERYPDLSEYSLLITNKSQVYDNEINRLIHTGKQLQNSSANDEYDFKIFQNCKNVKIKAGIAVNIFVEEVYNGGIEQFIDQSDRKYLPFLEESFFNIGCPEMASIAKKICNIVGTEIKKDDFNIEKLSETQLDEIHKCEDEFYALDKKINILKILENYQ